MIEIDRVYPGFQSGLHDPSLASPVTFTNYNPTEVIFILYKFLDGVAQVTNHQIYWNDLYDFNVFLSIKWMVVVDIQLS